MKSLLLKTNKYRLPSNLSVTNMLCIRRIFESAIFRPPPTIVGYLALIMWSLSACATVHVCDLPALQILMLTFFLAFFVSSIKLTVTRSWSKLKQPWYIWLIGVSGVCLQQFFYVTAFKHGPAAQVDIIIYLWPLIVILLSGFLPKEKIGLNHVLSAVICFSSIIILNIGEEGIGFDGDYIWGYIYAFVCALLWSGYTFSSRYFKSISSDAIGIYYGIGSLLALVGHLAFEQFVAPTFSQWLIILCMGVFVTGTAYYLWDYGIKKGNIKLLAVLSYANPILSVGFLYLLANAEMQPNISISCLLIAIGGVLGAKSC